MEDKRRVLIRNKAIAGGLMVVAAILFVIARYHGGSGAWEWVSAFSEAAMIGALADWFAVVALFRHPLGIPIPHTAIVPNKKNAIADSLAEFIRDKFLATEALVEKLRGFNPAQRLAAYLSSEENASNLASGLTRVIVDSLDFIDDERVRKIVHAAVNDRLAKLDLASCTGHLLDLLMKDGRHQAVLDEVLGRLAGWLAIPESQQKIAGAIDRWCSTEYPLLIRMIPNREHFMQGAGEKIAARLNSFIQEVNADPDHELRRKFNDAVTDFIQRLRHDAELRERVDAVKNDLVNNPALGDYIRNLLHDLKSWLRDDLEQTDSKIRERIRETAVGLGKTLAKSGEIRDSINEHLETIVRNHAGGLRTGFSRHVSGTIKQWEDNAFVNEIELSIGSDLQFIRMNGTLVGGMIGVMIHGVSLMIG